MQRVNYWREQARYYPDRLTGFEKAIVRSGNTHLAFDCLVLVDYGQPSQRFRGNRFGRQA